MKIAMLGHKRIPSREGGVEIVVEELASRMADLGHSVTCYNRAGHHVSGKEYDRDAGKYYRGIRIKKVLTIDAKGLAAVTSSFFASLCAAFGNYDLVHIHAEGPAFMCGLLKLFGKKVVVTIHGLDWQRSKWGKFASWYINKGERAAVKYADAVIVLSESTRTYFKDTYGRDTVYIPNGVEAPALKEPQIISKRWGLKKDGYILFLGRIVPEKGIHYLIEAYNDLAVDIKLVIAGGASDTDGYYAGLKSMSGERDIVFTGFVEGDTLKELYSNALLYVLPSDVEGMPLSLLEAMSYGNACLTSDIPECAGVIKDHGLTFSKGSVTDLTDKLREMLENRDMISEYKASAAAYILSKYNWDEITNRTIKIYEDITG